MPKYRDKNTRKDEDNNRHLNDVNSNFCGWNNNNESLMPLHTVE